jgi:hypothetical protein
VTHVKDIPSMVAGMIELNRKLKNENLNRLIEEASALRPLPPASLSIAQLPGITRWVKHPSADIRTLVYLIWKDPWMSVSRRTFIGSVLEFLGYGRLLPDFDQDYPEVLLEDFDRDSTLFLFASEPYPFARKEGLIRDLKVNAAIVDGERYCWYGMKSLEFLSEVRAILSPQHRNSNLGVPAT